MQKNGSHSFFWELSTFDTDIFGFKTAKITLSYKKNINVNNEIGKLVQDLKNNDIEYSTLRIKANDFITAHTLEKNNFIIVDGIITLEKVLNNKNIDNFSNIRTTNLNDLSQLLNIGTTVFKGVSRYYHDSFISEKKADEIYMKWIENSVKKTAADEVLVWEQNKKILGFITLQKKGQIPLIGVIEEAKGKGIGGSLINAACEIFNKWGLQKVTIETQMTNIPALRLYQSLGFKVVDSSLTFRWHVDA